MKTHKKNLLRALLRFGGDPAPEEPLLEAAILLARPTEPTLGDMSAALAQLELEGLVAGVSDGFGDRTWTLTLKGDHLARKL